MAVSVITPTRLLPDRLGMLLELNKSLKNNDCQVEHVIVIDGEEQDPLTPDFCPGATFVRPGRSIGQASARNLGLAVAKGSWITSADDDDWLHPHSIDKRLEAIYHQEGALWSAGYCTDDYKIDPGIVAPGPMAPGDIWRAWPAPIDNIPLGPTTLLVEANLLKRAGGWMGLPQGEDIGMMMAVTSMAPGVVIGAYVYHIRLHPGQMTKSKWFNDLELLSRRCAWERGEKILAKAQINLPYELLELPALAR